MQPLTIHERNIAAQRERERREAEIPARVAALRQGMEQALVEHWRQRLPLCFNPDDLHAFEDLLQSWLRVRFPDANSYPRIVAQLDPVNPGVLLFVGLPEFLTHMVQNEVRSEFAAFMNKEKQDADERT